MQTDGGISMQERIGKLDIKIQEYIKLGLKTGFFNNENIERVITRLERVKFSIDNNCSGDAQTTPIRDPENLRISNGLDVRINEFKTKNSGKFYFEDEVIFHELSHCVNGLYENWFENLSLYFDFDKIFFERFNVKQERIEELSSNPNYRQRAYAWLMLDEFGAQFISQKMVEEKYGRKIYLVSLKPITQSNPILYVNSNFADYHEFYELVINFIKPIYGDNVEQFVKDSLDDTSINKIFDFYSSRTNGCLALYSLLGEMGNIGFAVSSRNFTESQKSSDNDMIARDPTNFQTHYSTSLDIINNVLNNKTFIPGIQGNFN